MPDVCLIEALHLSALCDVVHHREDMATAQQMDKVVHKTLLQLKLRGQKEEDRVRVHRPQHILAMVSQAQKKLA